VLGGWGFWNWDAAPGAQLVLLFPEAEGIASERRRGVLCT